MLRNTLNKAFSLPPLYRPNIRLFATIPESVIIKTASAQNGLDITERAVKVRESSL